MNKYILNDVYKEYRYRLKMHMCKDVDSMSKLVDFNRLQEIASKHDKYDTFPKYYEQDLEKLISENKIEFSYMFLVPRAIYTFDI